MPGKLVFDEIGTRLYETGISEVVLFVQGLDGTYGKGVAWNGVTGITESPKGAEASATYADNIKYLSLVSNEELDGTIEALYSPKEFDECDGSVSLTEGVTIGQQSRKKFALVYKTLLGNDTANTDYGYVLHAMYGIAASPSEKGYKTTNDSPEAATMSWSLTTTPVAVTGMKPTSLVRINSTMADKTKLAALESILYGSTTADAKLLLPDEIKTAMTPAQG